MPSKAARTFSADWVLPITVPPIRGGYVSVADGRIVDVGEGRDGVDLGRVALLPALVNAHTHLELSYLRGRVPPRARFVDWVQDLLRQRRGEADAKELVASQARRALGEAVSSGTGVVGDVSNTLVTPLADAAAPVVGAVFHEVLGFRGVDAASRLAEGKRRIDGWAHHAAVALAPHAPYSVSVELFAGLRAELDATPSAVSTLHLAESPEEVQLLRDGTGPWREALEAMGVWDAEWTPPGASPVDYADAVGFLRPAVLIVHATQCSVDDIERLASRNVTVVVCPRSNRHVGVGDPPIAALFEKGVRVALGTDSLASAPSLNLFDEMAAVRRVAPGVPASKIVESATRVGAAGLGLVDQYGALVPGAHAAIIAVTVPDGVTDVEEYLVSGVLPDHVAWVSGPRYHG